MTLHERDGAEAVVDLPLLVILQNFEIQNDRCAAFSASCTQVVILTAEQIRGARTTSQLSF